MGNVSNYELEIASWLGVHNYLSFTATGVGLSLDSSDYELSKEILVQFLPSSQEPGSNPASVFSGVNAPPPSVVPRCVYESTRSSPGYLLDLSLLQRGTVFDGALLFLPKSFT